jgi:hypothetical protein
MPKQVHIPSPISFTFEEKTKIRSEILRLLEKGIIEPATKDTD